MTAVFGCIWWLSCCQSIWSGQNQKFCGNRGKTYGVQMQAYSKLGFARVGNPVQTEFVTHVSHLVLPVGDIPLDLQGSGFQWPRASRTCVLCTGTFALQLLVCMGTGSRVVRALARPAVKRLLQGAFEHLHHAVCIGVVVDRATLARTPDEDQEI